MLCPGEYDLETFLSGDPDGGNICIDPIFGKDLETIIGDCLGFSPRDIYVDVDSLLTRSYYDVDIAFVDAECATLMVDLPRRRIIGGYVGLDLAVHHDWRGRGLGAELVFEHFIRNECLPLWSCDEASFSPAGYAAHAAAWRLSDNNDFVQSKRNWLENMLLWGDRAQPDATWLITPAIHPADIPAAVRVETLASAR